MMRKFNIHVSEGAVESLGADWQEAAAKAVHKTATGEGTGKLYRGFNFQYTAVHEDTGEVVVVDIEAGQEAINVYPFLDGEATDRFVIGEEGDETA
jgi:hypothetical protein